MTFQDLQFSSALITALERMQITTPTPIQAAAAPVLLAGRNAYLHAETGTGKTLAYLLPLFMRIDVQQPATQVAILAPTHELAIQIQRVCGDLALHAGLPVRTVLLIGGTSTARQIEKLKKKPQIVVGSPGRMAELISLGKLKAAHLRSIVVDEADRLITRESLPSVGDIIKAAPVTRQVIFASATREPESTALIDTLVPDVATLEAGAAPVNPDIEHLYLVCEEREKTDQLRKLLHALQPERAMVFVHRADVAERITAKLAHHQIAAANLYAGLDKEDRKHAMDGFRRGTIRVLIASDVAARGLDIKGLTHIINFDVPTLSKAYLHRVGRTGRAGQSGVAVSLVSDIEERLIPRFEDELGIQLQRVRLREGRVIPQRDR